jgi:hypothetical protein
VERSRSVALWLALAVAALVVAGVVVVVLAWDEDAPAAGHDACAAGPGPDQLVLYFDDQSADEDMRAVEKELRGDDRVGGLEPESRHEAWERFKKLFADQPELVKLAREEALPAAVWLLPADGIRLADLKEKLPAELAAVDETCRLPHHATQEPRQASA